MHNLPTVSIITPSFNHAPFLDATIRSVLDQHYPLLQYTVMDGGSTDGTIDILSQYGDGAGRLASDVRNDPDNERARACGAGFLSYKWTSQPDAGQADAIRNGFARSTGAILGWLNSDDCYKPGAIMAAAQYLRDHPEIAVVYGDAEFIRRDGSPLCPCANTEPFNRHRLLHYSDYIVQPAAFFRRSAYEAVGGLDPSLHYAMDYDLWLKLAKKYDFAYVPEVLAQYRWLGDNKSASGSWQRIEEVRKVARRHGARRLPAYFRLEAVNLHLLAARENRREGNLAAALGSYTWATLNAISSPRALWSLAQPQTRRIIRTGRVLRAASAT